MPSCWDWCCPCRRAGDCPEGSPIFPKNAEQKTTATASSSPTRRQRVANRRTARKAALKAKHAAQELYIPLVSDANYDARPRGETMNTTKPFDRSTCNPVHVDSLDMLHQTEHDTPVRRINTNVARVTNAERVTTNPNPNGQPDDGIPLRFVRKEVLAAARRQADILAMVTANNSARPQRVIVVPINRSVALRLDPAMNVADNAIASDANYAADDRSPPITLDDDVLGSSEDDVVPHPDIRHGRNV